MQHVLHSESWTGSIHNILSHEIQITTVPHPHQGSHLQVSTEGDSSLLILHSTKLGHQAYSDLYQGILRFQKYA